MASESGTQDSVLIETKTDETLTSKSDQPHREVETVTTIEKSKDEIAGSEKVFPSLSLAMTDSQENYRSDNFPAEVTTKVEIEIHETDKQFQKGDELENIDDIECERIEEEKQGSYGNKQLHDMAARLPEVEHREPRFKIEGGESVKIISDQSAQIILDKQDSVEDCLHDTKQEMKCAEKDEEVDPLSAKNKITGPINQVQSTSEATVEHAEATLAPHSELEARSLNNDDGTETKIIKDKDVVTATIDDTSLLQTNLEGVEHDKLQESVDLAGELKETEGTRTSEESGIKHHIDLQITGEVQEKTESTPSEKRKEEVNVVELSEKIHGPQVSEVVDHPKHEGDTEQSFLQQNEQEEHYPETLEREYQNAEDVLDHPTSVDNKPRETKQETKSSEKDESRGSEVEENNVVSPINQIPNTTEKSLKVTEEDGTLNPKLEVNATEELPKDPEEHFKYTTGDLALNTKVEVEGLNKDDDKVDNSTIRNINLLETELEGVTCSKAENSIDQVGEVTGIHTITTCENIDHTPPNDTALVQTDSDEVKSVEADKIVSPVGEEKEIEKITTTENSGIEHELGCQTVGEVSEMIKPTVSEEQKEAVTVINADDKNKIQSRELSKIVDHTEQEDAIDHSLMQKSEGKEYPERLLKDSLEKNESAREESRPTTDSKEGEEGIELKEHSSDACEQAKEAAATAGSSVEDIPIEKIQGRSRGNDTGDIKEEFLEEGNVSSSALESSEAEATKHYHESIKNIEILKDDRIRETSEKGAVNAVSMKSIREDVMNSDDDNYDESKGKKLEVVKEYECTPRESNQEDQNVGFGNPEKHVHDLSLECDVGLLQQGQIQAPNEAPTVENDYEEDSSLKVIESGDDNHDEVENTEESENIFKVKTDSEEIPNDVSGEKAEQFPETTTKEVELDALGDHAKEITYTKEKSEKEKKKEGTATSVQLDNETGKEVDSEQKTEAPHSNIQKENLEVEATAELHSSFTVNETRKKPSEDDNEEAIKSKEEFSLKSKEQAEAIHLREETKVNSSMSASEPQKDHVVLTTSEASVEENHPPQNTKNIIECFVSVPEVSKKEIKDEIQKKEEYIKSHLSFMSETKISSSIAETTEKETEEILVKEETMTKDSHSNSTSENSSSMPEVSEKEIQQKIPVKEESTASNLSSIPMTEKSSTVCDVSKKETEKILEKEEPILKNLGSTSITEERDELKDEKEENKEQVESFNPPEEKGSNLRSLDTNSIQEEFKLEEDKDKHVLTFSYEGENNTPEANEKFPTAGVESEKVITVVEANLDPISDENLQSISSKELEAKTVEASKTSGFKTALIEETTDEKADTPQQATEFESEDTSINQEGHSELGSLDIGKDGVGEEAQRQGYEEQCMPPHEINRDKNEQKDVIMETKQEQNDLGHQHEGPGKETQKHEDVVQHLPPEHGTEFELEEVGISKKEIIDNLTDENHAYKLGASEDEIPINEASKHAKAPEDDKDILKKEYTVKNSTEKVTDIVIEEPTFTMKAGSQSQEHEDTNAKHNDHLNEEVSKTTDVKQEARAQDLKEVETVKIDSSELTEEETSKEYSKEDQVYKGSDNEDSSTCIEKQNLKDPPTVEILLSKPGETVIDTIKEESEVKCLNLELKEPTGSIDFVGKVKPTNLEDVIQSSNDDDLNLKEKSDGNANIEKGNNIFVASIVAEVQDKEYKETSTSESNNIIVRAESEASTKEAEQEDREIKTVINSMKPLDIDINLHKESMSEVENDVYVKTEASGIIRKKVDNEMEGKTLTTEIVDERDLTTFEVLLDATVNSNIQESLEFPSKGHQFKTVESSKTTGETSEIVNSTTEQITGEKLLQKPEDVSILEQSDFEKKNTYEEVQKYGPEKKTGEVLTTDDLNSVHPGSEELIPIQHDGLKNTNNNCSAGAQEEKAPGVLEEDQGNIQEAANYENTSLFTEHLKSNDLCESLQCDAELVARASWDRTPPESSKNKKEENYDQDHFPRSVEQQIQRKQLEEREQKKQDEVETEIVDKEDHNAVKEDGSQNITEQVIVENYYTNDEPDVSTRLETIQELKHSSKVAEGFLKASISKEQAETTNLEDSHSTTVGETAATKLREEENAADELSSTPVNFSKTDTEPLKVVQEEIKEEVYISHNKADSVKAEEITSDSSFNKAQMDMPVEAFNSCLDDASSNVTSQLPQVNGKNAVKQIEIVDSNPDKVEEIKSSTAPVSEFDNEAPEETNETQEILRVEKQEAGELRAAAQVVTTSRCLDVEPTTEGEVTAHSLTAEKLEEKLQTASSALPSNEQKSEFALTLRMMDAKIEEVDIPVHENLNVQKEEATELEFSADGLSTRKEFHVDRSSEVREECRTMDEDTKLESPKRKEKEFVDSLTESEEVTKKIIEETSKVQFETSAGEYNSVSEISECGKGVNKENRTQEDAMVEKLDINEIKDTSRVASGSCLSLELKPVLENDISAPDTVSVGEFEEKETTLPSTFPANKLEDGTDKKTEECKKETDMDFHHNSDVKNKGTKLKVSDFELPPNSELQINSLNEVHEEGHGAVDVDTKTEPSNRQEIKTAESPAGTEEKPFEEKADLQSETTSSEIEHVSKVSEEEEEEEGIKETDENQKNLNVEKLELYGKRGGTGAISEEPGSEPSKRQMTLIVDSPPGSKEAAEKPTEETLDPQFKTMPREIEHVMEALESEKEGLKNEDEAQQNLEVEKLDQDEVKETEIGAVYKDPKSEPDERQEIKVADSPTGSKEVTEKPTEETSHLQFGIQPREIEHVPKLHEPEKGVKEADDTQQNLNVKKLDLDGTKEAGIVPLSGDTKSEPCKRHEIQVADSPPASKQVTEKPTEETLDLQFEITPRETEHVSKEAEADEAQQNWIEEKLDLEEVKESETGAMSEVSKSECSKRQEIEVVDSLTGSKGFTEKTIEETTDLQCETRSQEEEHVSKVYEFEIEGAIKADETHNLDTEKFDLDGIKEDGLGSMQEDTKSEPSKRQQIQVADSPPKSKVPEKPIGETSDLHFETRPREIQHASGVFESKKEGGKEADEAQQKLMAEKFDLVEVNEAGMCLHTESEPSDAQEIQAANSPPGCKEVTDKQLEHESKVSKFEKEGIKEADDTQKNENVEKLDLDEVKEASQIAPKSSCLEVEPIIKGEISAPEAFPAVNLDEEVHILSSTVLHDDRINENTEDIVKELEMQGDEYSNLQKNEATKFTRSGLGSELNTESQIGSSNEISEEGTGDVGSHLAFEHRTAQETTHGAETTSLCEDVIEKPIEETSNLKLDGSTITTEHVSEAFESKNQIARKEDEIQKSITLEMQEQDETKQGTQGDFKSTHLGDDLVIRDHNLALDFQEGNLEEQLQAPSSVLPSIKLEDGIMLSVNEKEGNREQVEMQSHSHEILEMQTDVATELKIMDFGHVNNESLIASSNEVHQEEGGTLDQGTTLEPHKILEARIADPISGSREIEVEEKKIEEKSNMQFERSAQEIEQSAVAFESKNQIIKESEASQQSLVVEKLKQHEMEEASRATSQSMSSVLEPESGIIIYETTPKEKSEERQKVASSALPPTEQEHGIGITIQKIDNNKEVDDSLSVKKEEVTDLKVAEVGLLEIKMSQMDASGEVDEEAQDVDFVLGDGEATEKPVKKTSNQQFDTNLEPIKHVEEIYDTKNKAAEEPDESQQSLAVEKLDEDEVKETSQIVSKSKCLSFEPVIEIERTAPLILNIENSEEQLQRAPSLPSKQQKDGTEIEFKKTEAEKEVEIHLHRNFDDQRDATTHTKVSNMEVESSREMQIESSAGLCNDQGRTLDGDTKSEKRQESEIAISLSEREELTEKVIEDSLAQSLGTSLKETNCVPVVQTQEEISEFNNTEIKEKHLKADITCLRAEEDQLKEKFEPNIAREYTYSNEEVPQQQKDVSDNPPSAPLGKEAHCENLIVNEDIKKSEVLEKAETSERNEQHMDDDGTVEDFGNNENLLHEAESKDVKEARTARDFEDQGVNTNSAINTKLVIIQPEKKPEQGIEMLPSEGCTESAEIQKISRDVPQIEETAHETSENKPSQTEVSIGKTKTTISTGNEDVPTDTIVETPVKIEGQETKPEKKTEGAIEVDNGEETNAESPGENTTEHSITADWDKVSLADLINRSTKETLQAGKAIVDENEQAAGKEEGAIDEGHERLGEEKEHIDRDSGSDAPVVVEASKEIDVKSTHKKSHNILSGVGSKVKHSISKVKKAITGSGKSSSSHQKAHSPK